MSLAISGVTVYVLAKVIKGFVDRGRPSAPVEGVVEREPFSPESLGFPSGDTAVAWAITIIVLVWMGRPWRIVAIALAIAVPWCVCTWRLICRWIWSAGQHSGCSWRQP